MVKFLNSLPRITNLVNPIYDVTRKGRTFIWGKEQHIGFVQIKRRLQESPELHLADDKGRFHLYSYTRNLLEEVFFIKYKMLNQNQ